MCQSWARGNCWVLRQSTTRQHIEVSFGVKMEFRHILWQECARLSIHLSRVPSSEKYPIQAQSQLKSCGLNFDGLT